MSNHAVATLIDVASSADHGQASFDDFYREFYVPLAATIREWLGGALDSPHDVDDLAQTAFTALYVRWPKIAADPEARRGQLFLIAHNKTVDHLRHRKRWQGRRLPLSAVPDQACEAPGPASVAVTREREQLLRAAVSRTTQAHQAVIRARYVEERPFADLQHDFGRSETAMRQLTVRALRSVRRHLESLGISRAWAPLCAWRAKAATRVEAPPWAGSAGQCAFVSIVMTSIVMAAPPATPAAASVEAMPPRHGGPSVPELFAGPMARNDRPSSAAAATAPAAVSAVPPTAPTTTSHLRSRKPRLRLPRATVPPPPCLTSCPGGYTITVTVPFIENGSVSQEQDVVPCSAIPTGQSVVTCREDKSSNYAGSPSPAPGTG